MWKLQKYRCFGLVVLSTVVLFVTAFAVHWSFFAHNFARVYEMLFLVGNYDYFALYEPDFQFEGSRNQKIFCRKEHYSPELIEILKGYKECDLHLLRRRRNVTTRDFTIHGIHYVIKYETQQGILKNLFFMSRGVDVCNNGIWMAKEGISCLKPVAFIENRGMKECDSAVVYLYEGKTLGGLLQTQPELFAKVGQLMETMIEKSMIHHDFHIYNFVVLDDGTIQFIDIDKFHRYPFASPIFYKRFDIEAKKFNRTVVQDTTCSQRLKLPSTIKQKKNKKHAHAH